MRKLLLILSTLTLLSSCGNSRKIGDTTYECYGFIDKSEIRQDHIRYEFVSANLVPAILFSETIIAPILIFGFQSHCPISEKEVSSGSNNK